jgi:hypothetical protein
MYHYVLSILGLQIEVGDVLKIDFCGQDLTEIMIQYPDTEGSTIDP